MKYIGMNNLAQYKCGSTPQVGDTVKSDSAYTCLLHLDTPYEVLSVNEDKSKVYIKLPSFYNGLVYPTHWFSLISRKATSMKINVEAPTRPQTLFSDLKGGDWFKTGDSYSNYYLKIFGGPNDNPNAVREEIVIYITAIVIGMIVGLGLVGLLGILFIIIGAKP